MQNEWAVFLVFALASLSISLQIARSRKRLWGLLLVGNKHRLDTFATSPLVQLFRREKCAHLGSDSSPCRHLFVNSKQERILHLGLSKKFQNPNRLLFRKLSLFILFGCQFGFFFFLSLLRGGSPGIFTNGTS